MPKKKILIIDDEEDLTHFLKTNLELSGNYEVITASSGGEGLQAASQHKPDLIFLDLIMPVMDGYEVLRRLNKDYPEASRIPVAAITALKQKEHVSIAEKFGVISYLTKPFKISDMLAVIDKCC